MSSDDDDLLCYTPLQRSQISSSQRRPPKVDVKPSRLSLARRRGQTQTQTQATQNSNDVDGKTSTSNKTTPSKGTPNKAKRRSNKNTPIKSRADRPEENCSEFELAKWRFLFGSEVGKVEQKPLLLIKNEPDGSSQRDAHATPPTQKRKSDPGDGIHSQSGSKKVNEGVCSRCRFPYNSLAVKAVHSANCERRNLSHRSKCPKGASCSSKEEAHYWIYSHPDHPGRACGDSSRDGLGDGLVDLVDVDHSSTSDSGFNGAAGPSSPRRPSEPVPPCKSPDYLLPSDIEDGEDPQSMPLFDLGNEEHEAWTDTADRTRRDCTGSVDPARRGSVASRSSADRTRRDSTDSVDPARRGSVASHSSADRTRRDSTDPVDPARRDFVASRSSTDRTRRESADSVDPARRGSVASRSSADRTRRDSTDSVDPARRGCVASGSSTDWTRRDCTDSANRGPLDRARRGSGAAGSSSESTALLDPLIPDIELVEDDITTVCFGLDNDSHKSSLFNEEEEEAEREKNENQPSHAPHPQDDGSSGSVTPDLELGDAGNLDDPEGDELVGSVVEEAVSNFAIPALEKVLKWRQETQAALAEEAPQGNRRRPSSRRPDRRLSPPPCIHLHFHEASPAPASAPVKETGQTSILQFFKSSTNPKEKSCSCGGSNNAKKEESAAAWKGLMGRMQRRQLVPLPVVSESSQDLVSDATSRSWGKKSQAKSCPFYKYIPETNFVVDAFNYGTVEGVTAYFLTHFHYDHYVGLKRDFSQPIYCSEITARLVNKKLGVPLRYLNVLPMWEAQQVQGVEVTLLSANHCPGSVMFLFKVKEGVTHLHVGDFRADPSMESYTALHCRINTLFLDTTYCSPEYDFPPQDKIIEKCVSIALDHHQENDRTLFVVGSYTIGKERVFKAIAESLNCSIWVRGYKKQVLNCIDDKEILSRLTDNKTAAKVHVLPMGEVKGGKLQDYLKQLKPSFTAVVGLCPTGWEFTGELSSSGGALDQLTPSHPFPDVYIYGIPYSEHSSFSELRKFVQFIKPWKVVPTVNNGNQAARKRMEKYFREWLAGRQLFP